MHGIGVLGETLENGNGEMREPLMKFLDGAMVLEDGDLSHTISLD